MFQRKISFLNNTKPKADKNKDTCKSKNIATNHNTTTATSITNYAAKKSNRVGKLTGDNDTWMEGFAVVNPNSKKKSGSTSAPSIRTYFQSQTTGQKVWDEPPSGASNILYASEETREMAQVQVDRLIEKNEKKKKKQQGKDDKKKKDDEEQVDNTKKKSKANYKSTDQALQQAIEASLHPKGEKQPSDPPSSVTIPVKKKKKKRTEEDVAYKMAKAASISEHKAKLKEREQEDLMIKQAIQLSLEEEKLSKGFQEIMQQQPCSNTSNSCWSNNNDNSFILSDEMLFKDNDDFFSSSTFPFESNAKIAASNNKKDFAKSDSSWNERFIIPSPATISSMKDDRYSIAEMD